MDSSEDLRKLRLLLDSLPSKVRSGKGFSGGGGADDTGSVKPQGPVWIGRHFRLDRTNQGAFTGQPGRRQQQRPAAAPLAPRPWHTVLQGEKRQSRRMQWFQPVYVGLA